MIFFFYLFRLLFRFMWFCLMCSIWLCWAIIAAPVAFVAYMTDHQRVGDQWMRSVRQLGHSVFRAL